MKAVACWANKWARSFATSSKRRPSHGCCIPPATPRDKSSKCWHPMVVAAARLTCGAPLCRIVPRTRRPHGLEVALNGGQMGNADFFVKAKNGRP